MADGRRVGQFPQKIIGDQRLPLRVVIDERLEMSVQEIGGDCHLGLLGSAAFQRASRILRASSTPRAAEVGVSSGVSPPLPSGGHRTFLCGLVIWPAYFYPLTDAMRSVKYGLLLSDRIPDQQPRRGGLPGRAVGADAAGW